MSYSPALLQEILTFIEQQHKVLRKNNLVTSTIKISYKEVAHKIARSVVKYLEANSNDTQTERISKAIRFIQKNTSLYNETDDIRNALQSNAMMIVKQEPIENSDVLHDNEPNIVTTDSNVAVIKQEVQNEYIYDKRPKITNMPYDMCNFDGKTADSSPNKRIVSFYPSEYLIETDNSTNSDESPAIESQIVEYKPDGLVINQDDAVDLESSGPVYNTRKKRKISQKEIARRETQALQSSEDDESEAYDDDDEDVKTPDEEIDEDDFIIVEESRKRRHRNVSNDIDENIKRHKCEICGQRFLRSNTLTMHKRIHTQEKPYQCAECKKMFSQSSNLIRHMQIHTGEKPHECKQCGKRFGQLVNLKTHERFHNGIKPYVCNICGYRSSQSSHLKTHMAVHDNNVVKKHKCKLCGKLFMRKHALQQHTNNHFINAD